MYIQCYLVFFHAYVYITIKDKLQSTKSLSIEFSPSVVTLPDIIYDTRRTGRDNSWSLKYGSRYITIDRENSGAISDVRGILSWSSHTSECMFSPTPNVSRLYGNGSCYANDELGVTIPIGIVADTQFPHALVLAVISDISFIYRSRYNIEIKVDSFYVKSSTETCKSEIYSTLENFDQRVIYNVTNGETSILKRNAAWILLAECAFESSGSSYLGSVSHTAVSRKSAVVNAQKEALFHALYRQVGNLMGNNECRLLRKMFG